MNLIYKFKYITKNIYNGLKNAVNSIYNYILNFIIAIFTLYKNKQLGKFAFITSINFLIFMVGLYLFIIILKIVNNKYVKK